MPITMRQENSGKIVEVEITGKLAGEDYAQFSPQVERLIREHGKLRLLVEMRDFHGWSFAALWEDIKFDVKHFRDIERLAFVGETKWQAGMSKFCAPFTTAEIRYFDLANLSDARAWLKE